MPRAEHLGAEVGRGVDDDVAAGKADQDGGAQAFVAGVGGVADVAGTTDGRDA